MLSTIEPRTCDILIITVVSSPILHQSLSPPPPSWHCICPHHGTASALSWHCLCHHHGTVSAPSWHCMSASCHCLCPIMALFLPHHGTISTPIMALSLPASWHCLCPHHGTVSAASWHCLCPIMALPLPHHDTASAPIMALHLPPSWNCLCTIMSLPLPLS